MILFQCDSCKKPIDPSADQNFMEVQTMTIVHHGKVARIPALHFDSKGCFVTWLNKNSEPSAIITATNDNRGPAA